MLIPGFIIAILTFPGVIVHEIAHQIFCRLTRVAVFEVCYFQASSPCGYVVHEIPRKLSHQILIGVGPFFVNTVLGGLIAMPAAIPVFTFGQASFLDYFLIWLGVSICMHSFPSTGDAKSIWEAVKKGSKPFAKLVMAPIVGLIYLCAAGSIVWLDLVYGIAVAVFIPNIIIKILS